MQRVGLGLIEAEPAIGIANGHKAEYDRYPGRERAAAIDLNRDRLRCQREDPRLPSCAEGEDDVTGRDRQAHIDLTVHHIQRGRSFA
jgi:hypothetical protein